MSDKNSELVAKLRYQGKQYSAGQFSRGGGAQKHYLEDAADTIDSLQAELALAKASAQVNFDTARQLQAELLKKDEEIARLNMKLPCGHRKIDMDDSYGGCVLCITAASLRETEKELEAVPVMAGEHARGASTCDSYYPSTVAGRAYVGRVRAA